MGWSTGVRILEIVGIFSLHHHVHTSSGAHPMSSPVVTGALSSGLKQLRHEAVLSPPISINIRNTWSCTSTPPYVFMA